MTEQTEAPAAEAGTQPISFDDARARYAASKAAAKAPASNVSDAASVMGKRAAEARAAARQAQTGAQTQEGDDESPAQQVEDDPNSGTQDATETGEQSSETEAAQDEPATQTIDLGDGVSVTVDEVRDNFMFKADHTRKTQALAQARKEFEGIRDQKLREADTHLTVLKQILPQPKPQSAFIKEMGIEAGIEAFEAQNQAFQKIAEVFRAVDSTKQATRIERESARDKELAESYEPKWADDTERDKAYSELTAYALQNGASIDELRDMSVPAWVMKALDKSKKYDAIQSEAGNVKKLVADKPKVVKPGVKTTASSVAQGQAKSAFARLKSSGSMADAVAAYRALRGGKPRI